MSIERDLQKFPFRMRAAFRNAVAKGKTCGGGIKFVSGYYTDDGAYHPNIVTAEGQLYMLKAALAGSTQSTAWYLALWQNAVVPAESWTAADFATTAGENTSTTEGYTGNRQVWTPDTPLADPMSNSNSPAEFNIVTASSVSFQGTALLDTATRGGTGGVLLSAAAFDGGPRVKYNGDVFRIVFEQGLQPV